MSEHYREPPPPQKRGEVMGKERPTHLKLINLYDFNALSLGKDRVSIDADGIRYVLLRTKTGKLILNK